MNSTTRLERREPALYVVAEWEGAATGPRRLAIEVAPYMADGITSAVMRRADRHLADMTAEFNEMPAVGGRAAMVRHYVEDRLATLPAGGDDYHRGLLDIHDDLVNRGHQEPAKAIADAMRVPEETALACLRTARHRLDPDA